MADGYLTPGVAEYLSASGRLDSCATEVVPAEESTLMSFRLSRCMRVSRWIENDELYIEIKTLMTMMMMMMTTTTMIVLVVVIDVIVLVTAVNSDKILDV